MAEGFANHYGSDILKASSAGLSPVDRVERNTVLAMAEMNVDVSSHVPQPYNPRMASRFDLVVNMAGYNLPGTPPRELLEWEVNDPYGAPLAAYRTVRNDLEQRVMRLILDLRRRARR